MPYVGILEHRRLLNAVANDYCLSEDSRKLFFRIISSANAGAVSTSKLAREESERENPEILRAVESYNRRLAGL